MSHNREDGIKFNDLEDFRKWNEEMAHKYDPDAYHTRSNFIIRWIERKRVEVIRNFVSSGPQGDLLEVGCGAGNVLEKLPAASLYGLDLSSYLLGKSKKRLYPKKVGLVQANAEEMPFTENIFSRIICTEVLEHVQEPRKVLLEMVRVANGNAVLVISFPNESLINGIKRLMRAIGIYNFLLHTKKVGGYSSPNQMLDEWHLHDFDMNTFKFLSKELLTIKLTRAVPFRTIPLRYVVLCRRSHG
jgi:ubiquinone/menaquinone biosynthesis C-methylase UbiE